MMIRNVALSAQPLPLHTVVHDEFHVVVCVCVHLDWFTSSLLHGSDGSSHLVASSATVMGTAESSLCCLDATCSRFISKALFSLLSVICLCDADERRPPDPSCILFTYTSAGVCRYNARGDPVCGSTPLRRRNPTERLPVFN